MNLKLDKIIGNDKSLFEACDYLHDASFDLDLLEYDKEKGLCKFKFEREYFEDENLIKYQPKLLFFIETSFPIIVSELVLENIKTLSIQDGSKIGRFTFNECKIKKSQYVFEFCEDMEIYIEFNENPKGYIKDKNILNKQHSYWSIRSLFSKNKNR